MSLTRSGSWRSIQVTRWFETMNSMLTSGAEEQVQEYIDLLYNQSLLLEGSKIKDPAAFCPVRGELMTGSVKGKDAA